MDTQQPLPVPVTFVAELADPAEGRALRRLQNQGAIERIRRGAYADAPTGALRSLSADERYLVSIRAVAGTRRSPVVVSHLAAAAMHGYPMVDRWPSFVEITEPPESARRTRNGVVVRRRELGPQDVLSFDGVLVTSPARTLADVARTAPFRVAVAMLDFGLNEGASRPGQRVTKDEVLEQLGPRANAPGVARALEALAFADGRSGSPGESLSRVLIDELGFAAPELQVEHELPGQRLAITDFEWVNRRIIGEFDGLVKYSSGRYLNGRDPGAVVLAEKRREDALRRQGFVVVRWGMEELRHRSGFRTLLLDAGVPIIRRQRTRRM